MRNSKVQKLAMAAMVAATDRDGVLAILRD